MHVDTVVSPPLAVADKIADSASASKVSLQRSSGHDWKLEHQNQLDKLREEYEAREQKSQSQIDDIKTKSRKKIALLQSQLTDTTNKINTEKETFEAEISELKKQLEEAHNINTEQSQELAALSEKIRQMEEELQQVKEELKLSQHHSATPLKSEILQSIQSSYHEQSPMQSMQSTIPLIAMEEVLDDQPDSQVLLSGSADLGMGDFPTSLEQSLISMDPAPLGSPLQSSLHSHNGSLRHIAPQSSPPQCSISMLAMSRLSHHSSVAHVS